MQTIKPVSRQLADYLASVGLFLAPKPNSVYAPLVNGMVDEIKGDFTEEVSSEALVAKINDHFDSRRPNIFAKSFESETLEEDAPVEEGVLYDEFCKAAVNEIKPIVLGIVDGLKNIVNPAINTIFEESYNSVSDQVETGGVKLAVVTNKNELAIWSNAAFVQLVSGAIDDISCHQVCSSEITFPAMEVADLLQRIKTGNDLIDAEVADYLSNYNLSTLVEHTYGEIFNVAEATRYPGQGQLPESVVALLLTLNLMRDIPEGVYGMEETPYTLELARVACWHAKIIQAFLTETQLNATTDRLVVSYPNDGSMFAENEAIVVCGLGYAKFLDMGGSVDAIYGSYVGPQYRRLHEILEHASSLERQWLSHVTIAQSANLDDFQRKFVYELRRNIIKYGRDNDIKINDDAIETMFEDSFVVKPENAYSKVRPVILDALWEDTEYGNVLNCVDSVCDKLEGIEFDEALELGIIEWLVQWSLTHVDISYVKP